MKVNNNLIRRITSVCVVAALVFMFSVLPFTASAEKVTDLSITIQSAIYNPSTSASYVSVRDTLLNNETYNLASVEENIPMDYSTRVSLDMVFNKQDKSILAFADEAFTINISNLAYGVWIAGLFYSVDKVDHSNYQLQLNYTDGTIGYINSGISWTYNPNNETHQISFDVLPEKDVSSIRFWESIRQYDFTHIHGKYLSYVTMGSGDYPLSIVVDIETLTDSRLEGIEDKLDDQNQKLDDILTGGDAGDDLIAGGDRLEDAGDGLGDDLGAIQDFEDQYMGQLDDNIDEVVEGADLTWLYPALAFVQRYLNKIVAAVPSKYLIVFTLPMFFGLFMYIVGHPIRAPRPDTSGDEVTRETFTQTHILTGKGAGSVRSTRTVTTSREIGRVHNE